MPRKPGTPCRYPGCPKLVNDGSYCKEHKKLIDKQYNQYQRNKQSQSFYTSKEWLTVKKRHLKMEPLCRECKKKGVLVRATVVDHIKPIKQGGAPLSDNNLQSLCWSCHSRKSAKEGSRWGR